MYIKQIRPGLFLSTWQAAGDSIILWDNGITAVLNVAKDHNDPDLPSVLSFKIPLTDSAHNRPYLLDLAVETLALLRSKGHGVLVHCISGVGRSPHVIAEYLAVTEGRTYDDVYAELVKIHDDIRQPNLLRRA
jgi:protein-tyrosine phosphatase